MTLSIERLTMKNYTVAIILLLTVSALGGFCISEFAKADSASSTSLNTGWLSAPAEVVSVYDGDTFTVNARRDQHLSIPISANSTLTIDVQIDMWAEKIRLLGADAFEKRDPGGREATEFTRQFLSKTPLTLWWRGERGNFGRLLGHCPKTPKANTCIRN